LIGSLALALLACTNGYHLAQGDSWVQVDPFSGAASRVGLSAPVNAVAEVRGTVYGLAGSRVVTISEGGTVSVRGPAPASIRGGYAAAAVGNRWVVGMSTEIVSLDVPSLKVVAETPLSTPVRAGDFDAYGGMLYALADTSPARLVRITVATGRVSTVATLTGVPRGGQFGAVSIDPLGIFHAVHNATGRIFHIPLGKPSAFTVSESNFTAAHTDAATCPSVVDRGDAPASYGDPSHVVSGDLSLGASPVKDDGLARAVVIASSASSLRLTVSVRNGTEQPVLLAGWHDLDRNGRFDPADRTSVVVPPGARSVALAWPAISARPGRSSEMRLRLFGSVPLDPLPDGVAVGGEVEDYTVTIRAPAPSPSPVASLAPLPLPSPSASSASPAPSLRPSVSPRRLRPIAVHPPAPAPGRRTPLTWAVFIGLIVPALVVAARARR
jgi:hypothetical protein